jgi:hypothetical protein
MFFKVFAKSVGITEIQPIGNFTETYDAIIDQVFGFTNYPVVDQGGRKGAGCLFYGSIQIISGDAKFGSIKGQASVRLKMTHDQVGEIVKKLFLLIDDDSCRINIGV